MGRIRKWTDEDEKICKELLLQGKSFKYIGEVLNRTPAAIGTKKNKYFKDIDTTQIYNNNKNYKAIYQDYDWCYQKFFIEGLNHEEMAKEANCSKRVIEKWCTERHRLTQKYRQEHKRFNKQQHNLLIGSLLGDGHIDKRETQPLFIVNHAENQKDYLYYKYKILKDLCNKEPSFVKGGEKYFRTTNKKYICQDSYRICTRIYDEFIKYRNMTLRELLNNLNKYSFCIWMLDDAYRNMYQWELCIAEMEYEIDYIKYILKTKFNLKFEQRTDERYIAFSSEDSKLIDRIILKNIPNNLDIIKYKITENDIK